MLKMTFSSQLDLLKEVIVGLGSWIPSGYVSSVAMQAKKFLKGNWLKRVVFQRNLKYLRVGISFPWQLLQSCFDGGRIITNSMVSLGYFQVCVLPRDLRIETDSIH